MPPHLPLEKTVCKCGGEPLMDDSDAELAALVTREGKAPLDVVALARAWNNADPREWAAN